MAEKAGLNMKLTNVYCSIHAKIKEKEDVQDQKRMNPGYAPV